MSKTNLISELALINKKQIRLMDKDTNVCFMLVDSKKDKFAFNYLREKIEAHMSLKEEVLHELANRFMDQFPFKAESLDEFLITNKKQLSPQELDLGKEILKLFNKL